MIDVLQRVLSGWHRARLSPHHQDHRARAGDQFRKDVHVMPLSRYRPARRRFAPWEWARIYVFIVVVYQAAVLLLLAQGQDPALALAVPAGVGALAGVALDRLARLAVTPATGASARPQPRRA